jgi:hypothetical protein
MDWTYEWDGRHMRCVQNFGRVGNLIKTLEDSEKYKSMSL